MYGLLWSKTGRDVMYNYEQVAPQRISAQLVPTLRYLEVTLWHLKVTRGSGGCYLKVTSTSPSGNPKYRCK